MTRRTGIPDRCPPSRARPCGRLLLRRGGRRASCDCAQAWPPGGRASTRKRVPLRCAPVPHAAQFGGLDSLHSRTPTHHQQEASHVGHQHQPRRPHRQPHPRPRAPQPAPRHERLLAAPRVQHPPQEQRRRVGGQAQLLRRHRLGRPRRELRPLPRQGPPGRDRRPPRVARMGRRERASARPSRSSPTTSSSSPPGTPSPRTASLPTSLWPRVSPATTRTSRSDQQFGSPGRRRRATRTHPTLQPHTPPCARLSSRRDHSASRAPGSRRCASPAWAGPSSRSIPRPRTAAAATSPTARARASTRAPARGLHDASTTAAQVDRAGGRAGPTPTSRRHRRASS